jgi:hypothetical protein
MIVWSIFIQEATFIVSNGPGATSIPDSRVLQKHTEKNLGSNTDKSIYLAKNVIKVHSFL